MIGDRWSSELEKKIVADVMELAYHSSHWQVLPLHHIRGVLAVITKISERFKMMVYKVYHPTHHLAAERKLNVFSPK